MTVDRLVKFVLSYRGYRIAVSLLHEVVESHDTREGFGPCSVVGTISTRAMRLVKRMIKI